MLNFYVYCFSCHHAKKKVVPVIMNNELLNCACSDHSPTGVPHRLISFGPFISYLIWYLWCSMLNLLRRATDIHTSRVWFVCADRDRFEEVSLHFFKYIFKVICNITSTRWSARSFFFSKLHWCCIADWIYIVSSFYYHTNI